MAFDKDNNVVFILASPFMLLRSTDPLNIQAFADGYFNVPKGYYQLLTDFDIYTIFSAEQKKL